MLNDTQKEKVLYQFNTKGYVSRNWALQNYISRLGAIIHSLKQQGMNIKGEYYQTKNGKDYRYYDLEFML